MAKGNINRLNETLNELPRLAKRHPGHLRGLNVDRVRTLMLDILRDDPYLDLNEVSQDISLGARHALIKSKSTTDLRSVKRLTLLVHRVLGYHTSAQTRALKTRIINANEPQAMREFSAQITRGVSLVMTSLQDWLMRTAAEDHGSLKHYYNQAEDGRLNDSDLTDQGWCLGMSTQWLRYQANGGDFWAFMEEDGPAALRFIMAAQSVRIATSSSMDDRASFALKGYGLRKQRSIVTTGNDNATPTAMATNINANGTDRFCRIGQSYVGGGGHAMAATSQEGVTFFDPNAGEVRFSTAQDFANWLPKFVRKMGYRFSRHYVERFTFDAALVRKTEKPQSLDSLMREKMAARRKGMGY